MHDRARKTILRARKLVHANIKFVEHWFILFEGIFFNSCVLSQCIVYLIHFQNIHTFTYQETLLHTLFCLFKIVKGPQCILNPFMKGLKALWHKSIMESMAALADNFKLI